MNRAALCLALPLLAALCGNASAQFTNTIQLKPTYRETPQGGLTFSNFFVEGIAKLPDGVMLEVGVRNAEDTDYLIWVKAYVSNHEFRAEIGPLEGKIPFGTYACEAWFSFEKQDDATRADLLKVEEFLRCPDGSDQKYLDEYRRENPERLKELEEMFAKGVKCASLKQYGCKHLVVGTPEQAVQGKEEVRAFLRDHASTAREILKEVMATNARYGDPQRAASLDRESYAKWSRDACDQIQSSSKQVSERVRNTISLKHRSAHSTLINAFASLMSLQDISESMLFGALSEGTAEMESLIKKGEANLDMDERRRVRTIKSDIAQAEQERVEAFRRFAEDLTNTLYGPMGLDPAPEKVKFEIEKFKADFGMDWGK